MHLRQLRARGCSAGVAPSAAERSRIGSVRRAGSATRTDHPCRLVRVVGCGPPVQGSVPKDRDRRADRRARRGGMALDLREQRTRCLSSVGPRRDGRRTVGRNAGTVGGHVRGGWPGGVGRSAAVPGSDQRKGGGAQGTNSRHQVPELRNLHQCFPLSPIRRSIVLIRATALNESSPDRRSRAASISDSRRPV